MSFLKEVSYTDDDGDEVSVFLPHCKEVCPRCEGHGFHLTPSIGNHAYSYEEFNESFDEEDRQQYFTRGGMYDVVCERCGGEKVVDVLDEEACSTLEQRGHLSKYQAAMRQQAQQDADDLATMRGEMGWQDD